MSMNIMTYGRRVKQRKITFDDSWSKVIKSSSSSSGHIFSSGNDSSVTSNNSAEQLKKEKQPASKSNLGKSKRNKENESSAVKKVFRSSRKDDSSKEGDDIYILSSPSTDDTRHAFKDRSNLNTCSSKLARITRSGVKNTAKRCKKAKKVTKGNKIKSEHKEESFNFSEFENYSLVLESSPSYSEMRYIKMPDIGLASDVVTRASGVVTTSTPQLTRNIDKESLTKKESMNISHHHSPVLGTNIKADNKELVTDLQNMCVEIESMHMSGISNVTQSPLVLGCSCGIQSPIVQLEDCMKTSNSHLNEVDLSSIPSNSVLSDMSWKCHSGLGNIHQQSQTSNVNSTHNDDPRMTAASPYKLCSVKLNQLSQSLISVLNENQASDKSDHGNSDQSYNASKSLFDESLQSNCRSLRSRKIIINNSQDLQDSDSEGTEEEEDLSDIVEEEEISKECSDSMEDSGNEGDSELEEDYKETVEHQQKEKTSTTRYMINSCKLAEKAKSESSNRSMSSQNERFSKQRDISKCSSEGSFITCQSEMSGPITPKSQAVNIYVHQSPESFKTARGDSKNAYKPLCLDEIIHSFKVLSPVRLKQSGRIISPKEKVFMHCQQNTPISFSACIPYRMMKKCVKIGEGVYGEVFRSQRNGASVALKIIPIEGNFEVNDEKQKSFAEMLPEIVISKELSSLSRNEENSTSNFVNVNGVFVVQGRYPRMLLKEWDEYHKNKVSENDRPDMFDENQLFIIFEFEESGCDLESFQFNNISEAFSVLHQVTCALAVAEAAVQFEHRDLHWGNVLVKRTSQKEVFYSLNGKVQMIRTEGVKVAIIDFTLSRLHKDGTNVFCDLSQDASLFEGYGDFQFDVYRLMKEENNNEWESYHPYTNVIWIEYIIKKLTQDKSYTNSGSRLQKSVMRKLRNVLRDVNSYQSATHLLKCCPLFKDE